MTAINYCYGSLLTELSFHRTELGLFAELQIIVNTAV